MTKEQAQSHATTLHQLATSTLQHLRDNPEMHQPLKETMPMFGHMMTQLLADQLPTSRLEAAKLIYLATLISVCTVDDIAAVYLEIDAEQNSDTTTISE